MSRFQFSGKWEAIPYKFSAFAGLQSRQGAYTSLSNKNESDGSIQLFIHDELNEEFEPRKEQIDTINWISQNPEIVKEGLLKGLQESYPKLKEIYGYNQQDQDDHLNFPSLQTIDDLKKVIGVGNVYISLVLKDGLSIYYLECGCNWDEEHGLGIIMHKDKVLEIGGADIALGADTEVQHLKSSYVEFNRERQKYWRDRIALQKINPLHPSLQSDAILYEPHPIYKTFKPNQIIANQRYPSEALKKQKLVELQSHIESGRLNLESTFLNAAIGLGYTEAIKYFLKESKGTHSSLMQHANSINAVNAMLNLGYDINETDKEGLTVLDRTYNRMMKFNYSSEHLKVLDEFIEWLKKNGAILSMEL